MPGRPGFGALEIEVGDHVINTTLSDLEGHEHRGLTVLLSQFLGGHQHFHLFPLQHANGVTASLQPPLRIVVRSEDGGKEGILPIHDLHPHDVVCCSATIVGHVSREGGREMIQSTNDLQVYVLISAAALATYALRLGGLLLADRLPATGKFRRFMDALPGTILLSLVAPGVISSGIPGCVAAALTGVCVYKTGNVFISMLLGMATVAVARFVA